MNGILKLITLLFLAHTLIAQVKEPETPATKPDYDQSLQAIVVTTDDWDKIRGTATLLERKDRKSDWKATGDTFPVVVGRNGLGGDYGFERPFNDAPTLGPIFERFCDALQRKDDRALRQVYSKTTLKSFRDGMRTERIKSLSKYLEDDTSDGCFGTNEVINGNNGFATIYANHYPTGIEIIFVKEGGEWKLTNRSPNIKTVDKKEAILGKKEGDGRSPAGLFPLTASFGTETKPTTGGMPFTKLDEFTECVDDSKSDFYNRIVNRMQVGNFDWNSSEKMLSILPEYNVGVFVAYNTYPIEKGRGSCIFLHIWKDANTPTAGCTAMDRTNLERIIGWLSPKKNPYLVQMPKKIYDSRRIAWNLPKLK